MQMFRLEGSYMDQDTKQHPMGLFLLMLLLQNCYEKMLHHGQFSYTP